MPVKVQGPDGKTYEFPDGTTKEQAVTYFKRKAAPPTQDLRKEYGMDMSGGDAVAQGLFPGHMAMKGTTATMGKAKRSMQGAAETYAAHGHPNVAKMLSYGSAVPGMVGSAAGKLDSMAGSVTNQLAVGASMAFPPAAPIIAGGFGLMGASDALTPRKTGEGETKEQEIDRRLTGASTAAFGAAGLKGTAKPGMDAAGKLLDESRAKGATESAVKAVGGGKSRLAPAEVEGAPRNTSEFRADFERSVERGHMTAIEKQYKPRTMAEAAGATADYANKMEESGFKAAAARHPSLQLDGTAMAQAARAASTPEMAELFPEDVKAINSLADRFDGKPVPMATALPLLKRMNAIQKALYEAKPEKASAAVTKSPGLDAMAKATANLREQVYSRLESVGEKGIRESQKDYGALRGLAETFRDNIKRAESIGKGPSPWEVLRKDKYLLLGGLGGSEFSGSPEPILGAAGLTFLDWVMSRRATPNARIGRSLSKVGKLSREVAKPSGPSAPKGLLPKGPTELGAGTEPIENVGPTAQTAKTGRPARNPATGKMQRTYTPEGKERPAAGTLTEGHHILKLGEGEVVGSKAGAQADTAYYKMAQDLLGKDAPVSKVAMLAQELKQAAKK